MGLLRPNASTAWAPLIALAFVSARGAFAVSASTDGAGQDTPAAAAPATSPESAAEAATAAAAHQVPLDQAAQSNAPWELSLEQVLALALRDNLGLVRAESDANAARYDALSSWGAFDWVFQASANYRDSQTEGTTSLAGGSVISTEAAEVAFDLTRPFTTGGRFVAHFDTTQSSTTNTFFNAPELVEDNLRFSYVHPILRGGGFEAASSQQIVADLTARRAREGSRGTRQQLIADVASAYWDLVAALEQREVRRSALDLGREQLVREEQRLVAGDGTEVDVLQARTEIATRSEQLLQSENEVAAAADQLRALFLNEPSSESWNRPIVPMTPLPEVESLALPPTWESAWQIASEQRSELRQARLDVEASRARLRRAATDRLAGLDLTLNLSAGANDEVARNAGRDTFQFDYPSWSVLLAYELPLGNRTGVNSEQAARERLHSALVAQQESELEILADVRRAVREVDYRATAVTASAESLDLARRQLDAERARFDAELSTTFRVLEFQQSWIEALSNARRARADFAKALSDLARAQGLDVAPRD
ncbi:MAG: TolC family protein [Planctomycetota bacterium]